MRQILKMLEITLISRNIIVLWGEKKDISSPPKTGDRFYLEGTNFVTCSVGIKTEP